MIRVKKNLSDIPKSLIKGSTLSKRNGVLAKKNFPKISEYEKRYKQKDIREKLSILYKNKCAFCEQKITQCQNNELEECSSTVEHYRPKSKYYWLAYSWDNLLWCCHRCNQNKDNKFEIKKELGTFNKTTFLKKTHTTAKIYNRIEKPKMINPELESVADKLTFYKGKIDSTDERVKYTITICGLDREALNERRKEVIDKVIQKVNAKKATNEDNSDIFKDLLTDIKQEFIALRVWILQNRANILDVS